MVLNVLTLIISFTICYGFNLKLNDALLLINAADEYSRRIGLKTCIAVCDSGGYLLAFRRLDGCFPLAIKISQAKAIGSAMLNKHGYELADLYENRPSFFQQIDKLHFDSSSLPLIPGLGGLSIRNSRNECIGGIGVSGASPIQDDEIANFALNLYYGQMKS